MQLDLHEEGLGTPTAPIMAVVHFRVPFEIVVGLSETRTGTSLLFSFADTKRKASEIEVRQSAADAGEVAGFLKNLRQRLHLIGQMNFQLTPATSMMMGSDGRLIHPCDQRRTTSRADRRCDIGPRELGAFCSQSINGGCLHKLFAVAGKVRRHVIDDEPKNVWRCSPGRNCGAEK